ncbi:lamin tail domain-containing protein [Streptomyces sp. DSM 41602]|uniref:Lamin tail domain-containing protein n=1 Tax=Streptomyces antimycoticus TaxID=68175 RepID=A0ABD5J0G0_9ACTN|nr:lamin tail domain-containing protein [Streptomyces violaceusniger]MEE4581818.1 lamin tail domain-containing protein [Streptomyces sp. DSM 41602]
MRPRMLAAAVATAAASAVALLPTQAQAAGSIHLYKVYYDSPGSDTRSNSSLNAEYVQIKNSTSSAVQLKGYTLRDATGYKFTFPSYRISAGKTVKVHTGRGSTSAGHVYWGRGSYVWNNDKDTATLRTASGTFRDSCSYNSTRYDYKMC